MPATVGPPLPAFSSYAVAWIAFNGPSATWAAFLAWCEANRVDEAPRGPGLHPVHGRIFFTCFLCDLPRVRAWWAEHGGEAVRNCTSLAEPFAIWSDNPIYAGDPAVDPESEGLAGLRADMLIADAFYGVDWKARIERMAAAVAVPDEYRVDADFTSPDVIELRLLMANERGLGAPPSSGWVWAEGAALRDTNGRSVGHCDGWLNGDDLVAPSGQGKSAVWDCAPLDVSRTWAREAMIAVDIKRNRRML